MGAKERHLRQLESELGVTLTLIPWRTGQRSSITYGIRKPSGRAWADLGRAEIDFDPRSILSYFVGLHELGHLALNHVGDGPSYRGREIEAEAEAWMWAFDRAMVAPGRQVIRALRKVWLGSYVRDARILGYAGVGSSQHVSLEMKLGVKIRG